MKATPPRSLLAAALVSLACLACDRSRAELDHATELLGQVIAERDSLKSKLEVSQRKISYLENEVAALHTSAPVVTLQSHRDTTQRRAKTSANQQTATKSSKTGQKRR